MKKLFFILFIIAFLGSCAGEFDDVLYTINNKSSGTVSYLFNDISETLNKDESKTYPPINSEKGMFFPKIDFTVHHPRSINLTKLNKGSAGIFYTFTDNTSLVLNVKNTLTTPITLKANNFISVSDDTGADAFNNEQFTLTIKEDATEKALIYTASPKFTIIITPVEESDPFQIPVIEWELKDDTIYAVIHKRF